MKSYRQFIIFDLDDTLIDTSDIYWQARSRFVEILQSEGCDPEELVERFEKIDTAHIAKYGFAPERYGMSMLAAYRELAASRGRPCDQKVTEELSAAGRLIFDIRPQLIEGAEELLSWVRDRFRLMLITRGQEELQVQKVRRTGLDRFFSAIMVVDDKKADTFREVIEAEGYAPSDTWIIGDSIRTDINPGLEAGANCIHYAYRHHTYHWRQEHGHEASGRFHHVGRLIDIVAVLKKHAVIEGEAATKISR